ncbi:hypothetical protein K9N68_26515 [Kovacikia minuta CCNUW1]|nr:hypothetical protein [Kovacikia minuta]UBF25154.1 hypothetical protein K9N68_26515 [Kovacikia minuta CCNUW1]
MFKPRLIQFVLRSSVSQTLLKGIPFVKTEEVIQRVIAVRIPGGLTPP